MKNSLLILILTITLTLGLMPVSALGAEYDAPNEILNEIKEENANIVGAANPAPGEGDELNAGGGGNELTVEPGLQDGDDADDASGETGDDQSQGGDGEAVTADPADSPVPTKPDSDPKEQENPDGSNAGSEDPNGNQGGSNTGSEDPDGNQGGSNTGSEDPNGNQGGSNTELNEGEDGPTLPARPQLTVVRVCHADAMEYDSETFTYHFTIPEYHRMWALEIDLECDENGKLELVLAGDEKDKWSNAAPYQASGKVDFSAGEAVLTVRVRPVDDSLRETVYTIYFNIKDENGSAEDPGDVPGDDPEDPPAEEPDTEEARYTFIVNLGEEGEYAFESSNRSTVEELREQLSKETGVDLSGKQISLGGTLLEDGHTLSEYDIPVLLDDGAELFFLEQNEMLIIWIDGDGRILDQKIHVKGQIEPITDLIAVMEEDETQTYEFDCWGDPYYTETAKFYTPFFFIHTKGDDGNEPEEEDQSGLVLGDQTDIGEPAYEEPTFPVQKPSPAVAPIVQKSAEAATSRLTQELASVVSQLTSNASSNVTPASATTEQALPRTETEDMAQEEEKEKEAKSSDSAKDDENGTSSAPASSPALISNQPVAGPPTIFPFIESKAGQAALSVVLLLAFASSFAFFFTNRRIS